MQTRTVPPCGLHLPHSCPAALCQFVLQSVPVGIWMCCLCHGHARGRQHCLASELWKGTDVSGVGIVFAALFLCRDEVGVMRDNLSLAHYNVLADVQLTLGIKERGRGKK